MHNSCWLDRAGIFVPGWYWSVLVKELFPNASDEKEKEEGQPTVYDRMVKAAGLRVPRIPKRTWQSQ